MDSFSTSPTRRIRNVLSSATLVIACALAAPSAALAQEGDETARAEASERFQRALELFDEGNTAAALIEFETAYARASLWPVLYNIGACHRALGRPVEAVEAWERYLDEGGEAVPEVRRAEVEAALESQRGRIGTLLVRTEVPGARVLIDGTVAATTPMEAPIRLAIGEYRVSVEAAGWQASAVRVRIAGRADEVIDIELDRVISEMANLSIRSPVPGVEVYVDGEPFGTTPMEASIPVPPGRHEVEGRRLGFETFRQTVQAEAGQQVDITFRMPLAREVGDQVLGTLALVLPPAPARVEVNGSRLEPRRGRLRLPAGPHGLRLEVEGRAPFTTDVEMAPGETLTLRPELRWMDGVRAQSVADAERLDIAGNIVLTAGILGLVTGGVFVALAEVHHAGVMDNTRDAYERCTMGGSLCDLESMRAAEDYLDAEFSRRTFRWVYAIGFGIGVAAPIAGLIMVLAAPSEDDIDAAASAAVDLEIGLGHLGLRGRF